ncbi:MAG: hypothetical protein ABIL11_06935 [Chloroflexota bacterium]
MQFHFPDIDRISFWIGVVIIPPALLVPPARLANGASASTEDILHLAERAPIIDLPRLPDFIRQAFREGRALVLLEASGVPLPDPRQFGVG